MSFLDAFADFLSNVQNWVFGIVLGTLGKISYMLYMKRTLTVIQWVAVIGLSVFSGYMTSIYCERYGYSVEASWAVPMTTLMGEKLFIYVMANYKKIISGVLSFLMPKK